MYDKNTNCRWTFDSNSNRLIQLHFTHVDIPEDPIKCSNDVVEVNVILEKSCCPLQNLRLQIIY